MSTLQAESFIDQNSARLNISIVRICSQLDYPLTNIYIMRGILTNILTSLRT